MYYPFIEKNVEPTIIVSGEFRGGRFERYKEDFSKRVYADEFYQSFGNGEYPRLISNNTTTSIGTRFAWHQAS